jgi:carboxyl-terminal processing protease
MTFFKLIKRSLFLVSFCAFFASAPAYAQTEAEKQKLEAFFQDLESFTKVFSNIKQLYVDEVTNKELFEDAIKGMVTGLDPHSNYLKPKEQKNLLESASGKFG